MATDAAHTEDDARDNKNPKDTANNNQKKQKRPPMNNANNRQQPREPGSPPADEGVIRCICGYDEDDGFTIQASAEFCFFFFFFLIA